MEIDLITINWRFVGFEAGVLRLRFADLQMRLRFWPNALIEARQGAQGAWQDVSEYGEEFLVRAGFFKSGAPGQCCLDGHFPISSSETDSAFQEDGQLLFDLDVLTGDRNPTWALEQAFRRVVVAVPTDVRQHLRHFGMPCWEVLEFLSRYREPLDLMRSNPALLYYVLRRYGAKITDEKDRLIDLMRKPQHVLLFETLGLRQKAWVKIFKRVPLEDLQYISTEVVMNFEKCIEPAAFKCLQHCRIVAVRDLFLVSSVTAIRRILSEYLDHNDAGLVTITRLFLNAIHSAPEHSRVGRPALFLKYYRELEKASEELLTYEPVNWKSFLPFECPVGWEHLDTRDQIISEGRAQKNCLVAPGRWMTEGDFLFKVTQPVRASVHVTQDGKGGFKVAECKAESNYKLSKAELKKVEAGLNKGLAAAVEVAA